LLRRPSANQGNDGIELAGFVANQFVGLLVAMASARWMLLSILARNLGKSFRLALQNRRAFAPAKHNAHLHWRSRAWLLSLRIALQK
jgi:hypothetical protein